MGKIYVNYGKLKQIQKKISDYRVMLKNSEEMVRKANSLIIENGKAESLTQLEIKYGTLILQMKNYDFLLESLYNLIGEYKKEMTGIIKNKGGLTKVGVEDINWNLGTIKNALKSMEGIQSSVLVYADSGNGKTEEEIEKMKRNYNKIYNIWETIFPNMRMQLSAYRTTLQAYYDKKVLEYEKKDKEFKKQVKESCKIGLKAYIPNAISNQGLLHIYKKDFTKLNMITDKEIEERYNINKKVWEEKYVNNADKEIINGFIERQSSFIDMYFGSHAVEFNGCEVIAAYNALVALNHGNSPVSFPDLLRYYEKSGIMLNGLFGTDPQAICDYFKQKKDYSADIYMDVEDFINMKKQYDVYIFTYYNDKNDISRQIHTVAITKENGKYVAHNTGSIDPADSFKQLVDKMNSNSQQIISVVGIDKE